jgi:hypothetical protein
MKRLTLAAVALLGASMAASPALAAPVTPGAANSNVMTTALDDFLIAEQAGDRKWGKRWGKRKWRYGKFHKRRFHGKRRHRFRDHDDDFDFSFGFGFPLAGYGLSHYRDYDCIGWWHRHRSGRLHCHGQLVWD